jgi:hypothetical protein
MRWILFASLLTVSGLAVSGCKQGVGDRCNVDADCDDGLICSRQPGATPQSGGVCLMPGGLSTDMAVSEDGGLQLDLSEPQVDM